MKVFVCILAAFIALSACGGETAAVAPTRNAGPAAALPEDSGLVREPGGDPPCYAKLRKLASSEPVDSEKSLPPLRLVSGTYEADVPVGDLPFNWDPNSKAVHIIARCTIHKEGNVSDCNFICSYPKVDKWIRKTLLEQRYSPIPTDIAHTFRYHFEVD